VRLFSLVDLTAKLYLEKLEKKLESEGNPEIIIGDSAGQFLGTAMERYKEKTGVEFIPSVAYHHQGNSIVENKTKTAKTLLHSKIKEGWCWKKALREVERICNKELVSDSTGYTAFEVRTGYKYEDGFDRAVRREIEKRKEIQNKVIDNKEEARNKQKKYYDKGKRDVSYNVGDRVMVKDYKKTGWRQEDRKGPYLVEKELEKGNYILKNLII
jgi:hypothetical protein